MAATRRVSDFMIAYKLQSAVGDCLVWLWRREDYRKWFCVVQRSCMAREWMKRRRASKRFPRKADEGCAESIVLV